MTKNSPISFTLNKSALVSVSSVMADVDFAEMSNWKKVFLNYKSSISNQHHFVRFDATMESPTGDFLCSSRADDVFEIESITIKDFDNGFLIIPASELTSSEFKIDMGTVAPPSALYSRDFSSPSTPLSGEYSTIVNNLLELGQNSYELSNQPIVYEVGATYKLRVHIDSFVSGSIAYFIAKISPFSGQVNVIWEYDNTAVVNAVGSYLEGTFVATPTMNSNSYKVELAAAPSGSTSVCMKVSKFEIIKVSSSPPSGPSVILAGNYAVGSNPMQNLTSRSPAEGQSFVLSSPASVTSVKVMISKYSNPSNLPLTGTLNMTLKASDYSGNGAEVVSSNTLDLSTLATAQPTLDGGVICEFLFDTPVSLPSGTNSIKYNYAGLNVDGSTFIQVWGYSPTISDGFAYSYGGQIAHVDFWFQILGN